MLIHWKSKNIVAYVAALIMDKFIKFILFQIQLMFFYANIKYT